MLREISKEEAIGRITDARVLILEPIMPQGTFTIKPINTYGTPLAIQETLGRDNIRILEDAELTKEPAATDSNIKLIKESITHGRN